MFPRIVLYIVAWLIVGFGRLAPLTPDGSEGPHLLEWLLFGWLPILIFVLATRRTKGCERAFDVLQALGALANIAQLLLLPS